MKVFYETKFLGFLFIDANLKFSNFSLSVYLSNTFIDSITKQNLASFLLNPLSVDTKF